MIVIIDYRMGNTGSVVNIIKKLGYQVVLSNNKKEIMSADKLILPGVGAFDSGIKNLKQLDLIGLLNEEVLEKKTPILGICVGMQLMAKYSEEGSHDGLAWFDGYVKKFDFENFDRNLKIPCVGWNFVNYNKENNLFFNLDRPRYYFSHSYHWCADDESYAIAVANYGYDYVASINKDNIYAVQFHPEKSHRSGYILIKNFLQLC